VRQAVEDSLERLATDRIDLYQLHQPDPATPIAETLGVLNDLVAAGKVREIGCSNFSADQIREAEAAVGPTAVRFVSVQNEYSLLHREPERSVLAECERRHIAFIPYFPLASGLLSGKYASGTPAPPGTRLSHAWAANRFLTDERRERVEALRKFVDSRSRTLLELAVSWLLRHPVVSSVIAGATTPDQVRANVAAASWRLSAEDLAAIDRIVPFAS
jgi:aryl-alcohol dehydrogenase-like predicted oxidoreductase